jgi:hypothetical protein
MIRKLDLLSFSVRMSYTPTLSVLLERANIKHWTTNEAEIIFQATVSRSVCLGIGHPPWPMTKFQLLSNI